MGGDQARGRNQDLPGGQWRVKALRRCLVRPEVGPSLIQSD